MDAASTIPLMRIVFAANPGLGHLLPLLPLALAARDAGHELVVLSGGSLRGTAEAAGLHFVDSGPRDLATAFAMGPSREGLAGRRLAAMTWGHVFGGVIAPQLARGVLDLARDWPPDLVVHDDSEQGTWVAAERLGVAHVSLQATAWRRAGMRLSAEPLNTLRAALGLPPDPELARWHRHGYLQTRPLSLVDPADPGPATSVPLRPVPLDEAGGETPAFLARPAIRPRVAVTLGTIIPTRLEAIATILDALEPLDLDIVATVGHSLDPQELGVRRAGVHVLRYVPMSRLLATADALVFHAGSGTMLAAAAAAVPVVALPFQADQHENAERIEASGAGIRLQSADRTPEAIRAALAQVLAEPRFREAALRVRDEIAAMPAPEALVPRLERLAAAGPNGTIEAA